MEVCPPSVQSSNRIMFNFNFKLKFEDKSLHSKNIILNYIPIPYTYYIKIIIIVFKSMGILYNIIPQKVHDNYNILNYPFIYLIPCTDRYLHVLYTIYMYCILTTLKHVFAF